MDYMGNVHGFTLENWKNFKPVEDAFAISRDEKTIALADAITRDPRGMPILPDFRNLLNPMNVLEIFKFFKNYPKPSPAKAVANLFCKGFLDLVSLDYDTKTVFDKLNNRVKVYGEEWRIDESAKEFDYLEHDFPACVAVGLTVKDGIIRWGYIADCGLAVFNRKGEVVFRTKNEGPKISIDEDVAKRYKTGFRFPEGRKIMRSLYRNNPSNKLAYGALTGEKEAMHYVRTGEFELGDNILAAYTDGLEHVVYSDDFAMQIKKGCDIDLIERLCQKKVGTEGSLVLRR